MEDRFNASILYITHFVFLHVIPKRSQILLTFALNVEILGCKNFHDFENQFFLVFIFGIFSYGTISWFLFLRNKEFDTNQVKNFKNQLGDGKGDVKQKVWNCNFGMLFRNQN